MHRLTVFKHYVVCNVNDVVDGANSCRAQSHSEPEGRGRDLNVFDYLCGVAVAKVAIADLDGKVIFYLVAVAQVFNFGCGNVKRFIKAYSRFTSKTDNGEAVGAVGCDLELNNGVVKHKRILDIHTYLVLEISSENEDTVLNSIGHIVECEVKLGNRAEHTKGLNAAELTRLDGNVAGQVCYGNGRGNDIARVYVLRTCNDLSNITATDIHLAYPKMVGVGVTFHGNHLCNDNVLYIVSKLLVAFDLGAGVGHSIAVFLCGDTVCISKIVKPFK